jgi:hypothetical protein
MCRREHRRWIIEDKAVRSPSIRHSRLRNADFFAFPSALEGVAEFGDDKSLIWGLGGDAVFAATSALLTDRTSRDGVDARLRCAEGFGTTFSTFNTCPKTVTRPADASLHVSPIFVSSLHGSPFFVASGSRRRCGGVHAAEDGEGVVDTTSSSAGASTHRHSERIGPRSRKSVSHAG